MTASDQKIHELLEELRTAGQDPRPELLDAIRALGEEAVPPLIAMVTTPEEYDIAEGDTEGRTGWAPYSALAILGELHPPEALESLLSLLTWDDYDYLSEALPAVLAQFGHPVLDPLTAILADQRKTVWTRWRTARAMRELALAYPELRDEIVASLTERLDADEPDTEDVYTLRGALVSELTELGAKESIPSVVRAFEEDRLDPFVISWSEVRDALEIPPDFAPHLDEREREYPPVLSPPSWSPTFEHPSMVGGRRAASVGLKGAAPYRRETPKIGRNDPCPCGSGKKYKKCHGR